MPTPSYCNVGPDKQDRPHALTLYRINRLAEAVEQGRVYVPSPTADGLEQVRDMWTEKRSGVPVAICSYGATADPRFQLTAETAVSNLIVDPDLPTT